jgi:hypothetical protein
MVFGYEAACEMGFKQVVGNWAMIGDSDYVPGALAFGNPKSKV